MENDPSAANAGGDRELPRGAFPATRWSLVARLSEEGDEGEARAALEDLCQIYWFPLYAYVRRSGKSVADAEDLTQAYFAKLLEKEFFTGADKQKGKLRSFLLLTFKRFTNDQASHASAQRRGGGAPLLSIDTEDAEWRYGQELSHEGSPDRIYERRWALALLDQVLAALRAEYLAKGKGEVFDVLKEFLAWNAADVRQAEAAKQLGTTGNNVRVLVFRLRRRYGDLLREHIADTVEKPEEVAGEIDYLMRVLGDESV